MYRNNNSRAGFPNFAGLLGRGRANAAAQVVGSEFYPDINGNIRFYQTMYGVFVAAEFTGLPNPEGDCRSPIFAMHIHEGNSCTGNLREGGDDPFSNARAHYNPRGCLHPYHAGDMVPVFGANGYGYMTFLTDRFNVEEIIGRTVILHAMPDDFMTQPSGNSGMKIACGVIE